MLASALGQLPDRAWSSPMVDDVTPGYQLAQLVVCGHRYPPSFDLFRFVLDAFAPVWSSWLAKVPAGSHIAAHIDQGPYHERWHVPVVVAGTFDGSRVVAGVSFPVRHWEPHRVDNPTGVDRVHIVIDRVDMVDVPSAPFQRIEA
jgi:hypothetical protein